MVEIEFHYNSIKISLIAELNETIIESMNKAKINCILDNKDFSIIAHDKKIEKDEKIESIMTEEDKKINKIQIMLIPLNNENSNNFKEIICPECLESCRFNIRDYKINLYHTSGIHNIENIKIKEFLKMQNDLSKNSKNKENPNDKYICQKHNQQFIKYCTQCDENLCDLCSQNHPKHLITSFEELNLDINEIYSNLRKLKNNIDIFKNNLKEIIEKLNKVMENMDILYNINETIINSYSNNNLDYEKIVNLMDINHFINIELENLEAYELGHNINKILYLYNEMESKNEEAELKFEFIDMPEIENNIEDDVIIPIFGENFIYNNLYKCKVIYNNYEYELSHKFYLSDILYDSSPFSIIFKGINNIINMSSMFEGCEKIKSIYGLKNLDTSKVISMKNMFYECQNLIKLPDMSNWNTSNIINMEGMFNNNKQLKIIPDISKWDTSKVNSMMSMFNNCESLKSLPDISNWNITNTIDLRYMFSNCSNLTTLPDISKWNLINVKHITSLFKDCSSLISLPDISNWNTSNIISMNDLFQNCSLLTTIPDISKWNVEKVSDFSYSFMDCTSLISLPDLAKWDIKKCKNLDGMFINCVSLYSLPDFEKWNVYKINNKHSMFKRCFNSLNFPLLGS